MGTSNLPRRFGERLSRLTQQPGLTTLRLTFTHGAETVAVSGALRACFDQLTKDYVLPDEWVTAGGVNFCLTPLGDGLRVAREATGAVRGDAYTDYLDLLIGGQVHIATELTEDSYQPQLIFMISASTTQAIDQAVPVLEQALNAAGCEPVTL